MTDVGWSCRSAASIASGLHRNSSTGSGAAHRKP